jgi:transcriptional antiterminator RfaH
MPVLAAETNLYPSNLLDDFVTNTSERGWWAAYTLSRMEKALARQLVALDIPFYLPLIARTTRIAGRAVKALHPLFGGYLFVYASDSERVKTLDTQRVAQLWPSPSAGELTQDLRRIRSLIESGVPLTPESRLESGRRVRIKSGQLAGLEGVVISRRGEDRLLIAVEFLQQGVSIQISDYQVESI